MALLNNATLLELERARADKEAAITARERNSAARDMVLNGLQQLQVGATPCIVILYSAVLHCSVRMCLYSVWQAFSGMSALHS
jgi:hypothetical protein